MLEVVENCVSAIRQRVSGDVHVDGERQIKVEGTGSVEVEVLHAGPWHQSRYNTAHNDVLHINVHADCSRTAFGEPVKGDADSKAWAVWEQVDRLLHDQNHTLGWVVSSYRHSGPTLTLIPNGDGAVLLSAEYEVRS